MVAVLKIGCFVMENETAYFLFELLYIDMLVSYSKR